MGTHMEVTERALYFFRPLDEHADMFSKISADPFFKNYIQAGSFFPDWGYEMCGNMEDAAEAAHWPELWNITVQYIREKYPSYTDDPRGRGLVAFLLGMISHGIADVPFHSLDMDGGLIEALQHVQFQSSYRRAHNAMDIGGEFALAHSADLGYYESSWKVPTGDLVRIYQRANFSVTNFGINSCMTAGFVLAQANRLVGRYLFPLAAETPLVVDSYYDFFRGGVNDMSKMVAICWHGAIEWLEHGPILPFCRSVDKKYVKRPGGVHPKPDPGDPNEPGDGEGDPDEGDDESVRKRLQKYSPTMRNVQEAESILRSNGFQIRAGDVDENGVYTISLTSVLEHKKALTQLLVDSVHDLMARKVSQESDNKKKTTATSRIATKLEDFWSSFTSLFRTATSEMWENFSASINPWAWNRCRPYTKAWRSRTALVTNVSYAELGASYAVGDFDGDGLMDIAIGAPGYTHLSISNPQMGAVFILYNKPPTWRPRVADIESTADAIIYGDMLEEGSRFGSAMTVADLNRDGIDDLVVSAPSYNSVELFYDGRVYVFNGRRGVGVAARFPANATAPPPAARPGAPAHQVQGDAAASASVVLEAPQRAPEVPRDGRYAFLATALGATLHGADLDGDGFRDLLVGSPFADTGKGGEQQRGIVHAVLSSRLGNATTRGGGGGIAAAATAAADDLPVSLDIADAAAWSMDSGDSVNYQWFGAAIGFVPANASDIASSNGILLVGAPGWRIGTGTERAVGRVYGFDVQRSGVRPTLRFTLTGYKGMTGFGSAIRTGHFDDSGVLQVAIASPTKKSSQARSKFMDLPTLLTQANSHGYAAGSIKILDARAVPSGDTVLDGRQEAFRIQQVTGSRSNARLGGGGWSVGTDKMWIGEPLVDGETGRFYSTPLNQALRGGAGGSSGTNSKVPVTKMSWQRVCMAGTRLAERFGAQSAAVDINAAAGEELFVTAAGEVAAEVRRAAAAAAGVETPGRRSGVVHVLWG
ncbi:hypothetical protein DFJ73DRAFT_799403 [Zopfochytrium polystomum]|nr:hypothetical protein DFJ73DRAFT_799403 [Zopfochytrium polystomum]